MNSIKNNFVIKLKTLIDDGNLIPIVSNDMSFGNFVWKQPSPSGDPVTFDRCYHGIWIPNQNDDGLFSNEDVLKWYRTFHENQKDSDVEVTDDDLWSCIE